MQVARIFPLLDSQFDPVDRVDPTVGDKDWDWGRLARGRNKPPMDLCDYTEVTTLRYKDGSFRRLTRQKAASGATENLSSWLRRHSN